MYVIGVDDVKLTLMYEFWQDSALMFTCVDVLRPTIVPFTAAGPVGVGEGDGEGEGEGDGVGVAVAIVPKTIEVAVNELEQVPLPHTEIGAPLLVHV